MNQRTAAIIALYSSAVLYWIGFSMLRPIVALYFGSAGYSAAAVGMLVALQAVIPVLFAMPAGSLIDRIGTRNATWSGSAVLLLSCAMYGVGGYSGALAPMLIGQALSGIGSLLSWGALQAAAAHYSSRLDGRGKGRDHLLATFAFVNSLAQFIGPIIGGYAADLAGYDSVFVLCGAIAAVSIVCSLGLPRRERKTAQEASSVSFNLLGSYGNGLRLMRDNRPFTMAIVVNGVLFILIDIKGTFFPIYLANIGLTNTQIGLMLSIGGAASMIIRPLVGWIIQRLGYEQITLYSMILGGSCLIALVFEPAIGLIGAIVFLWGVCAGVNQPMALIMVARTVQAREQGMGMSLRTMSNRIVQVVNPICFGAMSGLIGLSLGFGAIGVMMFGIAVATRRMYKKETERANAA